MKELEAMKARHACVGDVRGIGLFSIIELVKDKASKEPLVPWNAAGPAGSPDQGDHQAPGGRRRVPP